MLGTTTSAVAVALAVQAVVPRITTPVDPTPTVTNPQAPSLDPVLVGHQQYRVVTHLTIDNDGHVIGCAVTESSGSPTIDQASCKIAVKRLTYPPILNADPGAPMRTLDLPVKFQIPPFAGWKKIQPSTGLKRALNPQPK